jgi:hypothetical protein
LGTQRKPKRAVATLTLCLKTKQTCMPFNHAP